MLSIVVERVEGRRPGAGAPPISQAGRPALRVDDPGSWVSDELASCCDGGDRAVLDTWTERAGRTPSASRSFP